MVYLPNETTEPEEHEQIEITSEMIEAGVSELALFDSSDRREWIVSAVYAAMERIARAR
jgi:hypothetical protein